ncbi:MAG: hypothetical protein LBD22_07785 [Spirochaetaceae bacterium]|jgi:hypothetical protein|nr:hypothetical protein [Spirochaetaceae bacterium]
MDDDDVILILTDEARSSRDVALAIVTGLFGKKIQVVRASEFSGTDILGASFCFLGCAKPAPPDFKHFEKVVRHINLTLRRCAFFSPDSEEAVHYLAELVKDSGIKVSSLPLVSSKPLEIKKWAWHSIKK